MKGKELFLGAVALGVAVELSQYAFNRPTRHEIGERDNWTCQGLYGQPCYFEVYYEKTASREDGVLMTMAHWPHMHGRRNDDPRAGRCLCPICHGAEEYIRGNNWGAKKMQQEGLYKQRYLEETGIEQIYIDYKEIVRFAEEMRPHYEEYVYQLAPRYAKR